jgi:hypothetical protein
MQAIHRSSSSDNAKHKHNMACLQQRAQSLGGLCVAPRGGGCLRRRKHGAPLTQYVRVYVA